MNIEIVSRQAQGVRNDLFLIRCDGIIYKFLTDARYTDDQIINLFLKDFRKDTK